MICQMFFIICIVFHVNKLIFYFLYGTTFIEHTHFF